VKTLRRRGLVVLLCAAALPLLAATPGAYVAGTLDDRIDLLVRDGYDHPAEALGQLAQLRHEGHEPPAMTRRLLEAQAVIQAQAGRATEAGASAERLLVLSREQQDPLAGAASNLARALVAETGGQLDVAAALAQSAVNVYQAGCPAAPGAVPPAPPLAAGPPAATCEYRSLWRALQILERRAIGLGQMTAAREASQAAFDVADAAGDVYRKAVTLSTLGFIAARSGQPDVALRAIAQARRMAASLSDPVAMVRVRLNEARIADQRGDIDASMRIT